MGIKVEKTEKAELGEVSFMLINDALNDKNIYIDKKAMNILSEFINKFIEDDKRDAVVDIRNVTGIDISSIVALCIIKDDMSAAGRSFYLINPVPDLFDMLKMNGVKDCLLPPESEYIKKINEKLAK